MLHYIFTNNYIYIYIYQLIIILLYIILFILFSFLQREIKISLQLLLSYCKKKLFFHLSFSKYFQHTAYDFLDTYLLYRHRRIAMRILACSITGERSTFLRLYSMYSRDGPRDNLSGWNLRRIAKRRGETREACPREKQGEEGREREREWCLWIRATETQRAVHPLSVGEGLSRTDTSDRDKSSDLSRQSATSSSTGGPTMKSRIIIMSVRTYSHPVGQWRERNTTWDISKRICLALSFWKNRNSHFRNNWNF